MCIPSFVLIGCCESELHGPIVMYGLRLFIVALQELHCLPNCLHVCMIRVRGCYHFTKFFAIMSPSFVHEKMGPPAKQYDKAVFYIVGFI